MSAEHYFGFLWLFILVHITFILYLDYFIDHELWEEINEKVWVQVCVCVQFNQTGRGSVCSQAIMLVTDGAVDMYDSVFEKYNSPDKKVMFFECSYF